MSLYTPVFPPCHEFNSPQKGSPEGGSEALFGKQQHYVKYLRDLHLFLSAQNDVLSPPSRPNSPLSDYRVQKMEARTRNLFNSESETWESKWTRASMNLRLGCIRGRHRSVAPTDACPHEQIVDWLLPDEESEWIEWEKEREEKRRLRGKTNVSQQAGNVVPNAPDTKRPGQVSFAGPSQSLRTASQQRPPGVSPRTLRAAKEKVKRWQASMPSEAWDDTTRGSSPASIKQVVPETEGKRETAALQRSRTLDFAVVKSAAKPFVGKTKKGFGSHRALRGYSASVPLRESKSSKLSTSSKVSQNAATVDVDKVAPAETPTVKPTLPRIANVPETPYLPPSFPANLETSTPLPNSKMLVRAQPSPIPPAMLSTPPSTPANPDDPQINIPQQEKRSRASSTPADGIGPPSTPPAKRQRTVSQSGSSLVSEHPRPVSPGEAVNIVDRTRNEARDLSPGETPSHQQLADTLEAEEGPPLTPAKTDQPIASADVQEVKIPSPTKSVRSFFSAPDSDSPDSPLKGNLLLESPVSPMLSYAQNPSVFLPQITSTQLRKGLPTTSQANDGIFGLGFSSQFDVERHVDRVSELLEKDVDFDGWLQDARTVETSHD